MDMAADCIAMMKERLLGSSILTHRVRSVGVIELRWEGGRQKGQLRRAQGGLLVHVGSVPTVSTLASHRGWAATDHRYAPQR